MTPTRIPVALALGLTVLLACVALYSGTTRVGPLLGQGPFDVKVGAIILVCVAATAGIAWSISAILHSTDEGSNRAALQSATLTAAIIGILVIATIAALGTVNPLAAGMVALLLILASVAALRCFDSLAQGRALGFESHWGGLGGGGGGWRLLPATALALLALSFTGAAVMIAFGELKQPSSNSSAVGNASSADNETQTETNTASSNVVAPAATANETTAASAPAAIAAPPALVSKPKLPPTAATLATGRGLRKSATVTLRLDDSPNLLSPLDEWPLPTIAPFVDSSAQLWLARDVKRFIDGRVAGRSYLIAGHRGSGKTALITRVIDLIRTDMMRASVRAEGADLADRPFQRPLLVKLHGPSMLEPPADAPTPAPTPAVDGQSAQQQPPTGKDQPAQQTPAASKPPAPAPGVHAALVQMSIGLYRALAAEAAKGYRAHARIPGEERPGDRRELAAQLALDLDGGIAPERLREFWLRIGRLRDGVLWPKSADRTLEACQMDDQGLREIVAIATASQAFQVCSGRVSYETTKKNSDSQTATSETKGSTDLRELIARLGTLGVGALAGATVYKNTGGSAATAIGAGMLTWLVGSLSISWSRSRTRKDDQTVDYSFIRDSDPATLDRDLPVVITRLRESGLAPIFVVDELDKVKNAADEIVSLVNRLKHLIADFGFFCFLVDRSCYVEFQRRIDLGGYPPEHTLFSERLLLTPEADQLYRFLLSRVIADPPDNTLTARAVFVLSTMHEARMNLTEVMRVTTRAVRAADGTIGEPADMLQQRRQIVATVQVAIDEAMRTSPIDDRVAASPGFAQLAVDTLYYPSVVWAKGETEIDASREKLKTHLKQCIEARADGDDQTQDKSEVTFAETDVALLQGALVELLDALADLTTVRTAATRRSLSGAVGAPADDEPRLSEVVPAEVTAIVKRGADGIYHFLFDRDGELIGTNAGRLTDEQIARAEVLIGYADAFVETLGKLGVTLDELVETPLLAGLSSASVNSAREQLKVAASLGTSSGDTLQQLATLERLLAEVGRSKVSLARLLALATDVRVAARRSDGVVPIIRRLLPLSSPPDKWLETAGSPVKPMPLTTDELRTWYADLQAAPARPVGKNIASPDDYQRLNSFFDRALAGKKVVSPFRFDDLVMAALEQLPFRSLSVDPATMTAQDWSSLALAALPSGVGVPATAPYWVLPAALRGLGFGLPALSELVDHDVLDELKGAGFIVSTPELTAEECMRLAAKFVTGATERPTGTTLIDTDEENYGGAPPTTTRPTLVVRSAIVDDYAQALNWLNANGILTVGADARPAEMTSEG